MIYASLMKIDIGAPGRVILQLIEDSEFEWQVWAYDASKKIDGVSLYKNKNYSRVFHFLIRIIPHRLKKRWFMTVDAKTIFYFLSIALDVRKSNVKLAVVHVSYALCWIVKLFSPSTTVVYYHHGGNMHLKLDDYLWRKLLHASKELMISVTDYAREGVLTKFNNLPNKFVTIHNGKKRKNHKPKVKLDGDRFTFCYAGRMTLEKGVDNLIDAFSITYKKDSNIQLLLIGELDYNSTPHDADVINRKLENVDAEVRKNIVVTRWQSIETVEEYINSADVCLLASQSAEGNSLFAIESLHAGKPLIVTRIGGNLEINTEYLECALIIEVGANQVPDFANAMLKMKQDTTLYNRLSANAMIRANDEFIDEVMKRKFNLLVNDLIRKKVG